MQLLKSNIKIPGTSYIQACMPYIPFTDHCFDHIVCANMLQHLPSPEFREKTICELARVIKPEGKVVISVQSFSPRKKRNGWNKEGNCGSLSGNIQYIYRFDIDEFRELLERFFIIDSITGCGFPLIYKWKLSPLSIFLERHLLQKISFIAKYGFMYVAECHLK